MAHKVLYEVSDDGIATLTINRPEVGNAIDRAVVNAITRAIVDVTDNDAIGAVVMSGAGERVFAAGADINELRDRGRRDALAGMSSALFAAVQSCPKPTIAAVNGYAAGGGCELALACDIRLAAAHAMFSLPEADLGVIPAAGGTQRLPRIIGLGRAVHMVLTGEPVNATTALAWGLVSAVVPAETLLPYAHELATRIGRRSPLAVRLCKVALHASSRVDLDSGLLIERLAQAICFEGGDKHEGTAAFLEKRPPRFQRKST